MLVGQSGDRMANLPWPLALRSQLVPHKLTTEVSFYPCTFLGVEAESSPKGSSRRVKNTPWFQDYVQEDTK